jgi:anti-sigma factor RsiW
MNDHDRIRELLPLAAAGALDESEERDLAAHLAACSDCATEMKGWHALSGALRRIPTPRAPEALVNRVQIQLITHAIREAERKRSHRAFFWLILFGWTTTIATWPVLQFVSNGAAGWLHIEFLRTWYGPATFSLISWLGAAAAAAFLCLRHREERGLA